MQNFESSAGRNEEIEPSFVFPALEDEGEEIQRTAEYFDKDNADDFVSRFFKAAQSADLQVLSDADWNKLENTDSLDVAPGDWDAVKNLFEGHEHARDWNALKLRFEQGKPTHAPILLRKDGRLYQVSGNTRLTVAHVLGIRPKVLIVEL